MDVNDEVVMSYDDNKDIVKANHLSGTIVGIYYDENNEENEPLYYNVYVNDLDRTMLFNDGELIKL